MDVIRTIPRVQHVQVGVGGRIYRWLARLSEVIEIQEIINN